MSTITDPNVREQIYNGILRAENGWVNGTPSGGDIGTVSEVEVTPTPLVLDLNGDGVQTLAIADGVKFDFDGDGQKEKSGWVDSNDGLLALDLNGNGKIDDGTELFGDKTIVNGKIPGDAFRALRFYDGNNDDVIDDQDDIFDQLLVWIDSNSNGKSSKNELFSLSDLGIITISLDNKVNVVHQKGNFLVKHSAFTYKDGNTASMVDVHFDSENVVEKSEISLVGLAPSQDSDMPGYI